MIREDKFIQSRQPYAVDLESLTVTGPDEGRSYVWARVDAVWFRRRRPRTGGEPVTVACLGLLRDLQDPEPRDVHDFLARFTDGRYGGHCAARWDGATLWAPEMTPEAYKAALGLLEPMLSAYPAIPEGYDGWWTFRALPSR